jgi:hypothetical protein
MDSTADQKFIAAIQKENPHFNKDLVKKHKKEADATTRFPQ